MRQLWLVASIVADVPGVLTPSQVSEIKKLLERQHQLASSANASTYDQSGCCITRQTSVHPNFLYSKRVLLACTFVTVVTFSSVASAVASAKEDMSASLFVRLSVCLSVSNFAQKLLHLHEIFREG